LLLEVLQRFEQSQHVLIDALGLPLLPAVLEQIEALFPDWRLTETTFARIEGRGTHIFIPETWRTHRRIQS
jgi:hypothetical protein